RTPPAASQTTRLSLHDALPISQVAHHHDDRLRHDADGDRGDETRGVRLRIKAAGCAKVEGVDLLGAEERPRDARSRQLPAAAGQDRKSTRLNSSHDQISYAVFC